MNIWQPHNYQLEAVSFLLTNPKSALFLDPGLGKTSTSLCTIKIIGGGVLVVVPKRPMYLTWPKEIENWRNFTKLSYCILHGKGKVDLWGKKKDIYLINPEGLKWLFKELLIGLKAGKKCPFSALWIDESTKFKNHKAQRFEYLAQMLPLFTRRHIMSGTPASKGLQDLWAQFFLLDEGEALGNNFYKFRAKYFHSPDWNEYQYILNDGAEEEIKKRVAPVTLEMSAEDYLDMPQILYNQIYIDLPEKARKQYSQMEREFFIQIDDQEITAKAAVSAASKCHQIANGRIYEATPDRLNDVEARRWIRSRKALLVHREKQQAIADLVEELAGKPLLVAYYYQHDLEGLRETFGADLPHIGRGVSDADAAKIEAAWNRGEIQVLALHPDTGAHGLNLQKCANDICFYSLSYSTENYLQFVRRIYRQGVSGQVRIHHLIAKNTIDEAIFSRLGDNAQQQIDFRAAIKIYRETSL
jgi:SNF2 family DNA or RNA helicase